MLCKVFLIVEYDVSSKINYYKLTFSNVVVRVVSCQRKGAFCSPTLRSQSFSSFDRKLKKYFCFFSPSLRGSFLEWLEGTGIGSSLYTTQLNSDNKYYSRLSYD